jgi:hypothetical protein
MSNEKNYIYIETQPQRGFIILYLNIGFIFNGKPPCQMKGITIATRKRRYRHKSLP